MKEYSLFLDETKPNTQNKYFCLAGFIIENEELQNDFSVKLQHIKEEILNTGKPLHAYDMRKAKGNFEMMRDVNIRSQFYAAIKELVETTELKVIGTIIDANVYKDLYNSYKDVYSVLFHAVLESYLHFLIENNGIGSVYMESRNIKEDQGILREYYNLYLNGSLYYDSKEIQDHIRNVYHLLKLENNLGLQFADFIPGYIVRRYNGKKDVQELGKVLRTKIYCGNSSLEEQFGIRSYCSLPI